MSFRRSVPPAGVCSPLPGKQLFGVFYFAALAGTVSCGPAEPANGSNSSAAHPAGTDSMVVSTSDPMTAMPMSSVGGLPSDMPLAPPPPAGDPGIILGDDLPPASTAAPAECASADAPASLSKVVMAFVFDVSASMGSEYEPFHSRMLKWDPVVAATKSFFSDPASKGLSATITFFPNEFANLTDTLVQPTDPTAMDPTMPVDPTMPMPPPVMGMPPAGMMGQAPEVCDATEYETPDVPLTDLPSKAFGAAIDAITPPDELTWRLSTPTLAALDGTIQYLEGLRQVDPSASYTLVLVTDGMPQLCPGADDVDLVADAVGAVSENIKTYVIGVENPITEEEPNPPPSVDGMNTVAERGGTGEAFVIDTTDPTKTAADFSAIINQIRESSFSCGLPIPEPPDGLDFNKEQINVQFAAESGAVPYEYDPDCAGTTGWRFDNEEAPTEIELCPAACDALLAGLDDVGGELNVQFGCERRTVGSR